ncbi:MAG: DUF309 domain-containing protein [Thermomicrobiales bacterium]
MKVVTEPVKQTSSATDLRLGLSSGALYPEVLTEDVPAIAARWGVRDLELMLQTPGEYEAGFVRRLLMTCRAAGCRVHAVHSFESLIQVTSPYRRRAAEARGFFDRVITATAALGAGVLVWHGPRRREVETPEGWERFIAATADLAAACGEAGVTLALENVSWCALPTVRDVMAFAARLGEIGPPERVGFAFDPFQAASAGANPFMVLAAMGDRVVDVHLSDHREGESRERRLPPGAGDLPWSALLRAVAGSYRGPLMIEAHLTQDPEAFARVRGLLTPILGSLAINDDPCQDAPPAGVLTGIRLFNERQFYECHEEIEHEWHAERRPIRALYQGILQIGVGFHHARAGNHKGAILLLTDGIEKTARFIPTCQGIDTVRLVAESQACLDRMVALGAGRMHEFDWENVPFVHVVDLRAARHSE